MPKLNDEQEFLFRLALKVEEILEELREAGKEGAPFRSRELSLAITDMERGSHWLSARLADLS